MQQTNSFKGIVMLLLCSFIWGTAFVAQSVGADLLGPFSFNGIRSFLGAFFLVPCIAVIDRLSGKPLSFSTGFPANRFPSGELMTATSAATLLPAASAAACF